jgi:hypothetical protein
VMSRIDDARNKPEDAKPETEIERKRIGYLVREEFSRKLVSYVITAVATLFFGLAATPAFSSAVVPLEGVARSEGWVVDLLFLAILSIVSINVFSRSYFQIHRDPFYWWMVFLRSLPVSPGEMVLARSLIMLPATVVMAGIFLAPISVFSLFMESRFGVGQYLWFALIWLGYALLAGGINLLMELGVRGKLAVVLQNVWLVALVAAVWLFGGDIVYSTFTLAGEETGPLAAGASLLAGGAFFALLAKATERRVEKREFVT